MSNQRFMFRNLLRKMKQKIIRARIAISTQKSRFLKCPYCNTKPFRFLTIPADVEAKCSKMRTHNGF